MQRQQWIDSVRRELYRLGLPSEYIARLTGELIDHADDLHIHAANPAAASDAIEQTLGDPRDVAQAALVKFRQARFAGRHPIFVFVLLPIPLVILVMIILVFVLLIPLDHLFSAIDRSVPAIQTIRFALVLLPIILPALGLFRVARRAAVALPWRIVACAQLCIYAGALTSGAVGPTLTGPGRMSIGLGLPLTPLQCVQLCIPLVLFAWSYRRFSGASSAADGVAG